MHRSIYVILLGLSATTLISPAARAGTLGVAGYYSEFVFGDSKRSNTSTQGQVAVGGDARFNNVTIGGTIDKSNIHGDNLLIVGGKLSGSQAVLTGFGDAQYGSSSIKHIYYKGGGSGVQKADPSFFTEAETYLKETSKFLAGLDANGETGFAWGGITLSGTDAALNVFNLAGDVLAKASSFTIDAPSASTVIVNIDGDADSMKNLGFTLKNGIDASQILYNFWQASSLSVTNIGVEGTVLAPLAAMNFNNGKLNGSLIADSLSGTGTVLNHRFAGDLPTSGDGAIPEPASIVLVLLGAALILTPAFRGRSTASSSARRSA